MTHRRVFSLFNRGLLVGLLCLAGTHGTPGTAPRANCVAREASAKLPRGLPADWWAGVQKDIRQSEYEVTWQERIVEPGLSPRSGRSLTAAYQAPNRAHDFRTYFTPEGIRVVPRRPGADKKAWVWGIELTAYGAPGNPARPPELSVSANRIEYRRGGVTEWYVNDEHGLEQGFTLTAPPPPSRSRDASQIALELSVSGDLAAKPSEDAAIAFSTAEGVPVVRYGGLQAQDANGRDLPAWMETADAPALRLVVDTTSARYPITIDPMVTAANWITEGNQADAHYGETVATAGDVNGDGYDDVIVGAPYFDNGQNDEGKVWVYQGSANGLKSSAAFKAEGNQAFAQYGEAVATAGDVNGDGYSDVIVGAPFYDNGQADEGKVWVFQGSASGLKTPAAFTVEINDGDAEFGYAVGTAGDVNRDGYDDVIVGAPTFAQKGRIWVFHGSAGGLIPNAAFSSGSQNLGSYYGHAVATAGDVNGDGFDDVIIGAPLFDNGQQDEGKVWVYKGSATGLKTPAAFTAEGNQASGTYGWAVATAGDVNGDGYSDVIVGAPYYDNGQTNEGKIWVYHGSAGGLIPNAAFRVEANQTGAGYGTSVGTAGDVNGDGYSDVIVGAPAYDNGQMDEGQIWLYHGSASGLISLAAFRAQGNQAFAYFGIAVGSAGDVNGDGYDDVIVGASLYNNGQVDEGRAYVYHGPL